MVRTPLGSLGPIPISLTGVLRSPSQALRKVTSKDGLGVYASADTLFKGAVFGRDSIEVAEDLMTIKPKLAKKIILTLASLQGCVVNRENEEEPGKIVHEYRRLVVDGRLIDGQSRQIFNRLAERWGGHDDYMAYYGSVDATPHFIRALGSYVDLYGGSVLRQNVNMFDGRHRELKSVLVRAVGWLIEHLEESHSGLLEYQRLNPRGIENQVWKDSREFYVHNDGLPANHSRPIASIEVQGLAYDALLAAAKLLPSRNQELQTRAEDLRQRTLQLLWLPDDNYFALGIDYRGNGQIRRIMTVTANPAALLDTAFFDGLESGPRRHAITILVSSIMGVDFLTDAGIRSRALSEAGLVDHWDYHGSFTSWPKETNDIARGLRRQRLYRLAEQLENRLLNVIDAVKAYPEFIYVDRAGRVLGMAPRSRSHGEVVHVDSYNQPEKIQAWTVSAIISINNRRRLSLIRKQPKQPAWIASLEKEVLRHMPMVRRLRTKRELAARYPSYPYELTRGREI